MDNDGEMMYQWANDLFPICRSITGDGVRKTLRYIQKILPDMKICSVSSGTRAFDWTIPEEWNICDAYVLDENNERIIDFKKNNLHVVGYSIPVEGEFTFSQLDQFLYSLPDQPDAIPYVTSYYKRRWGFCITHRLREMLRQFPEKKYKVKIESSISDGELNYGELVIPGDSSEEILFSTYVCHPSMANNELSGPCLAIALADWISNLKKRRCTYRILFLVETIGSIAYLSSNLSHLKQKLKAGFVLTCVGDDRTYSYIPSRQGNTLADRVAKVVLKYHYPEYIAYSFLDRGSDERQYCSPGVDLPVCCVCRSKYGVYPEYHTSDDNMDLISPKGFAGSFNFYKKCVNLLECNSYYMLQTFCEPQLGKRNLYPNVSTKSSGYKVRDMMNFLAYCDGSNDLIDIARIIDADPVELTHLIDKLIDANVIACSDNNCFTSPSSKLCEQA